MRRPRCGSRIGSVTWWIFWSNGYQPLGLLDDDRDGRLSGSELDGLGVWRDRNANGISEPEEVIPASEAGIASIATRFVRGDVAMNPEGVILRDGSTRPTYDWVPVQMPGLK